MLLLKVGWTQTYVTQELSKKLHQNLADELRRVEAVQGRAACPAPLPGTGMGQSLPLSGELFPHPMDDLSRVHAHCLTQHLETVTQI